MDISKQIDNLAKTLAENHKKLHHLSNSAPTPGCTVDLTKIAELGQAHAQFELIRTMATEAQTRYGNHLYQDSVNRMGDIAEYANFIMGQIMAAFDAAK